MADRRISHCNIKLTCHLRTYLSLEQGHHRRSETPTMLEARLGNRGAPGIVRQTSLSSSVRHGNRQQASRLRPCEAEAVDVMTSGRISECSLGLPSKTQKPVQLEIFQVAHPSFEEWMADELMVGSECVCPHRFRECLRISTLHFFGWSERSRPRSALGCVTVESIECVEQR